MDVNDTVSTRIIRQTVQQVGTLGCMTVFTGLGRSGTLTSGDYRLGRSIGDAAPGVREVAADTICSRIGCHMLGQLSLGICHVRMTRLAVITTRTAGIGISKVVMTRLRLIMRIADAVERCGEASIVGRLMTICTCCCRTGKLRQVW